MFRQHTFTRFCTMFLVLALLSNSVLPVAHAQSNTPLYLPLITNGNAPSQTDLVFRTHIQIQTPAQWRDLKRMEVVILEQGADWATVLVDDLQLTDLARWRFSPTDTDTLEALVAANMTLDNAATSFHPLLGEIAATKTRLQVDAAATADARANLRTALQDLSSEQQTFLLAATSVDTDNDGLNDTLEGYWCTDPVRADTDFDGVNDGTEVQRLKDWMDNKLSKAPSSAKPFQGWPPQKTNCFDDDLDSVPDVVEVLELGLDLNQESTDRDKFDDGQELFGTTYCPGSAGFCGYGVRPRNEDWGTITAQMPSWVKAPGHHPLVAAYPVPEIDVVESSLKIETVSEITTDRTIAIGTRQDYGTTKTEGASTSVANTETWNNWRESFESRERLDLAASFASTEHVAAATRDTDNFPLYGTRFESSRVNQARQQLTSECEDIERMKGSSDNLGGGVEVGKDFKVVEGKVHLDYSHTWERSTTSSLNPELANRQCKAAIARFCEIAGPSDPYCKEEISQIKITDDSQLTVKLADIDNLLGGLGGIQLAQTQSGQLIGLRLQEIAYTLAAPKITTGTTVGSSTGGARTFTTEQYEEHSVSNTQSFSTEEAWGIAIAVDSAHAADLWFSYKVRNTGTEYSREIANLAFNLYIGDDPNPAYTYFVAPDIGGSGKFQNFMPDEEHTYTSRRIPLSLEQIKLIDLGARIRIIVEDFTYGIDELFYRDAANAGILVAIEDGQDDNNETIDTYLIPTWGDEKVLHVLARYFPYTTNLGSANLGNPTDVITGTLTAIWSPEHRSDTPDWCQSPRRPTDQPTKVVWCKRALSTADWWNIYTDGLGDDSEGFQNTQAVPGSIALFRFNQDTDLDGFSDRSETRLGTDPKDASSFPHPEVLAGVHNIRSGNRVTSTLSLLNSGIYDAYGVEAVMVAPDDSVSITNNTVGGSGRVRALKQVIVGSSLKLQTPLPAAWTQANHATPGAGGYYTGPQDRTYTFTVTGCPAGGCTVGSGSWKLDWSDGRGANGQLDFGANYKSPTFLPVGTLGLTLALYSGNVANGESFTVNARTPRDTFQYTINRQPYTEPLVIVSYNDPQGNHRFVLPSAAMSLTQPTANLQQFAGTMLDDVGVEIVTSRPFTVGVNSATLLVNNPSAKTLQNARLFLEVINISGTVVSEVPTQVNLPPGPTAVPVSFNTGSFNPAYRAADDYIVMAFLTDYQGNILDTAGRPLSSFQADPLPTLAVDDTTLSWDIGMVTQGTLLKHPLALANTGFGRLYTYIPPTSGLALNTLGSRTIGAADQPQYELTLRTADLPVGAYDQTITLATSDPARPTRTLRVYGTITVASGDTSGGVLQRPLDFAVNVPGSHSQGEWVDFTHDLGPEPVQNLHPMKVYSQDYSTLYGVGKYATDFGQSTTSYGMFGDGRDGVMPGSGNLDNDNGSGFGIVNSGSAGSTSITVTDAYGVSRIKLGDVVLIHQTQGSGAGCWELNKAAGDFGGTATYQLAKPMKCNYTSNGSNKAQILRVPQYSTCNVTGLVIPLSVWNGSWGGIFAVLCNETMNLDGSINANGYGFRGGQEFYQDNAGFSGESYTGPSTRGPNPNGGGGGSAPRGGEQSGGGGGFGSVGGRGYLTNRDANEGLVYGSNDSSTLHLGSGGGGARWGHYFSKLSGDANGSSGGGLIAIWSPQINIFGNLQANGNNANYATDSANRSWAGGGGSGGEVYLVASNVNLDINHLTVNGGNGGNRGSGENFPGGKGGSGRIIVEYCDILTGTTNPPASTQKLNCYITEQVETAPYGTARLNLPESFSNGRTYNVQFGRKLDFGTSGEQTAMLRVPAGLVANSTLDVLFSNAGTGNVTLKLDIGNNGSWDWEATQNMTNAATFSSPDLSAAFNQYWTGRGAPTTGNIEIPVKLWLSKGATAFITNLQQLNLTASGAGTALDPRPLDVTVVVTGTRTAGEWVQFSHNLGPEAQGLHPTKVYNQQYQTLWGVGKYAVGNFPTGVNLPWWNTDYRYRRQINVQARDAIITPYTGKSSFNLRSLTGIRADLNDVRVVYWDGSSWVELDRNIVADDLWLFPINTTISANQINNNFWLYYGNSSANTPPSDPTQVYVPRYSSGVTSWYRFTECSGAPNDTGPDNNDLNTGANGTYVRGKFGCAYQGNGSNQYALKGAGDINKWHNTWVVEFWATKTKYGGDGGNQNIAVAKWGDWGNIDSFAVGTRDADNSSRVWIKTDNSREYIWNVGLPATWNEPHHLAYIFRRDVGGFQFFWDGQLLIDVPSGIYQPTNTQAWTSLLTKGTGGWSGRNDYWGGTLEQVIISNVYRGSFPHAMIKQDPVVNVGAEQPVWITEQVETAPYDTARLSLPESFTDNRTYKVQFGRKLDFTAAGNQVTTLRVPAGLYNSVQLDALVSGLPANATLALDVGNDGSTEWSSTVANNSTNASADLAVAFTAYWRSQGSPTTGTLDVPIKVTTTQPGQVLLTNLQVSATGSRLRYVRVPVATYTSFLLDFTAGSGGTVALDLGDNGSIDWSASLDAPRQLTANLKDALNAYLAGKSGEVAVPVRFYLSPLHPITLNDYQATVSSNLDLTASSITVGDGVTAATADSLLIDAGSTARVQATLNNGSNSASGPVTAAFFATATGWGDWYIGSAFVANIPAGGNRSVSIPWNTTGFSGTVPVKVVINPYRRVAETNYINNSKAITVTVNPPVLLPAAPTGLVATMAATNRINLTWGDASSNESGFKIERSLDGVNGWTPIATVGANVTTYASIGLACGKAYFYRVRATNSNGDSAFSNVATTLTRLCTPPIQPLTAIAAAQLTVQWGDNNSNESGFKIERSLTGATPWSQIATVGANVTTYTHSGLQCGTPYYYRVRAYTGSNNSAYSASVNATTTICPPAAPTLLAATAISATQISLSWQDNSSNESGIKVERSPDGVSGWTLLTTVGANVTGYADNGVACATPYHYRVRATNTGGDSPNSNVVNATTPACLPDLIFADGFESGNFSAWSGRPVGTNLRITATAALANSVQGLAAAITTNTGMYLTDQRPVAEPRYRARFYFDPNAILMTNGNAHFLFYGYQGTTSVVLRIEFRRFNDTYQLRAAALNDAPPTGAATWRTTSYVIISDAPHYLELDWQAATAPGANNGSLTFWIDGVQRPSLTGLDNDTRRIDIARLGPIGGLDTGTRGSYYFDAFESRRRTYIGPVGGSALAAELTTADETLTTTVGTVLATSALRATEATTLTADMAGLGVEVTFPAISDSEALTAQLRITDTQSLPAGYTLLGDMLTVQTSALVTQPVTITIAYGAAATETLTTTVSLQQWNASTEQWEALPTQVNQDTQTITAVIKTPATIALWQPETEKLPVESVEENGATEETAAPAQFSIYLPLVQE